MRKKYFFIFSNILVFYQVYFVNMYDTIWYWLHIRVLQIKTYAWGLKDHNTYIRSKHIQCINLNYLGVQNPINQPLESSQV